MASGRPRPRSEATVSRRLSRWAPIGTPTVTGSGCRGMSQSSLGAMVACDGRSLAGPTHLSDALPTAHGPQSFFGSFDRSLWSGVFLRTRTLRSWATRRAVPSTSRAIDQARAWLRLPANPNGRTNADVLKPWVNGMDLTRRPAGKWIVDFGWTMSDGDAALYEEPFRWVKDCVHPMRQRNRPDAYRAYWWRHVEPRQGMWAALGNLSRYIATPTVAKHRLFVWCDVRICPDHQLIVITRDDDVTFGILHSRFHEAWSLRLGTSLEDRPRYTPTTTFETFPFPDGLTPNTPATDYESDPRARTITEAAKRLVELRDRWLNPPEWVDWVDEPVPGYPKRPVPRDEDAAKALKKRTLTNLYNARPQWLAHAHAALDAAVASAYGWPADISDDAAPRRIASAQLGELPLICRQTE